MKKKIIFDVSLVIILLAVALLSLIIIKKSSEQGEYVRICVNGEIIGEYSLDKHARYSLNNGTNTVVIENGFVYMESADCPDKTCVHVGKISKTGQRIVCLPNRVVIEVLGGEDEILGG